MDVVKRVLDLHLLLSFATTLTKAFAKFIAHWRVRKT